MCVGQIMTGSAELDVAGLDLLFPSSSLGHRFQVMASQFTVFFTNWAFIAAANTAGKGTPASAESAMKFGKQLFVAKL